MSNGLFELGIFVNNDGTFDMNYYGIYGGDVYMEVQPDGTITRDVYDDEGEFMGVETVNLAGVLAEIWAHITGRLNNDTP